NSYIFYCINFEYGRISKNINVGAKVSVLGTVIGEEIAYSILGDMWKTKRLFAMVLEVAPGNNRWIISLDTSPDIKVEVSASRMKFVSTINNNLNEMDDIMEELEGPEECETDISSEDEENEEMDVSNESGIMWVNKVINIDSRQVNYSYSRAPVVHISDIVLASPRQLFECFLLVEYIMSIVLPSTNKCASECERSWNDLTWMEFMRFIGILTIMTYVHCADSRDYWSINQETDIVKYLTLTDTKKNDDPFFFAREFYNAFNDNLSNAITPEDYLCIDEFMCQWMAIADARTNLFLCLDPVEPPEFSIKKKFSNSFILTVATILRLTESWFHSGKTIITDLWFESVDACVTLFKNGLYSILQIKKCHYWPKKISSDITDMLENEYGSFCSRTGKLNGISLILCSLYDRKDHVVLASCSTTNLKTEIKRYIKNHRYVTFLRPVIFDQFNEYRSAIDILNNFFLAYCQFVPGKENLRHVDFCKQLAILILEYYSVETISDRAKKRRRQDYKNNEHYFTSLQNDPTTKQLKEKHVQYHCMICHKCATTCCTCIISCALCMNCWADHIHDTFAIAST
ncbi:23061_t:CDS:2, partial [Gigaspora margarita]